MKCIKKISTEEIKRVDNDLALSLTESGAWVYIKKQEWKATVRTKAAPSVEAAGAVEEDSDAVKAKKAAAVAKRKMAAEKRKARNQN